MPRETEQSRHEMMDDFFQPDSADASSAVDWEKTFPDGLPGCSDPKARPVPDPYQPLLDVLREAFEHASIGKGLERHSCGEPFLQQTICQIIRAHGIGFGTGQAEKKARESHRLLGMENGKARAVSELLGAINYLAAAIIVIREGK